MSKVLFGKIKVPEKIIKQKLEDILDTNTRLECCNLYAKMMDPYVPFLEGPLSQTVDVTPKYVRYHQPYARYQYEGIGFNHTLDYHPLASAYWDKAMMRDKGSEFREQIKAILMRRAGELNGR